MFVNANKPIPIYFKTIFIFLVGIILLLSIARHGLAATNCSPGLASVIGTEYVATSCPWESTTYTYKGIDLICQNGAVIRDPSSSGDTSYANLSPQSFQNMLVSQAQYFSMKVFRNAEGTRFLLVNKYFGNGGSIDGKSVTTYPAAPAVSSDVFNKVLYVDPAAKPPCCLKIKSFTSDRASITPAAGESTTFNGSIFANYPVTWNLSIVDRLFAGSGTAAASWDGKNAAGTIVAGGLYSANLTAQTSEIVCADSAATGVTVTSMCDLKITSFNASPQAINPTVGGIANMSWTISDSSGTASNWTLTVAGKTMNGSGSSAIWNGKDSSERLVPPGAYAATLSVTNANGCSDSNTVTLTVSAPPARSCPSLDIKTN